MANRLSNSVIRIAESILPSPMTIAILLTVLTFFLALILTKAPYEKLDIKQGEAILGSYSLHSDWQSSLLAKGQRDSFYLSYSANNQELLIKAKNKELIYRQQYGLNPKKEELEQKVKLNKGPSLMLVQGATGPAYALRLMGYWEKGFFNFLTFAMQMMLILVLGHVLALSTPANRLIQLLVKPCNSSPKAALIVCFSTLIVAFFNWGLALVFGAILARKVGEYASEKGHKINYPLVAAAGYAGLMVWHGGLSGSAPLKIAEEGHEMVASMGVIPISETIFSSMNLVVSCCLLIILPLSMAWLGKRFPGQKVQLPQQEIEKESQDRARGAEKLDRAFWFSTFIGLTMVFVIIYNIIIAPIFVAQTGFDWQFRFINPNFIIFLLFGMAILLHGSLQNFQKAVGTAIGGASGIMIQFPLYAGIMGIMLNSGLVDVFSNFFVAISNETTYPIYTFFSAGLVNMFVPSGGGQWLVQGPILIESSQALGVPLQKSIMALCYGDQITNMLQPFWALPLLGITQLKAQQILPYTFFLFVVGSIIFCTVLLLF